MKSFEEQILEIMMNFNFDRVHRVMQFLEWKWATSFDPPMLKIPSLDEIKDRAVKYLRAAAMSPESEYYGGTGGLIVEKKEGCLFLSFVLADWDGA